MLAPAVLPLDRGALSRLQPATELTAERLWDEVSGKLRDTLNETTYHTWFGEAEAGELGDGVFAIVVPNDFTREWIEGHFLDFLRSTVTEVTGREFRIAFSVAIRLSVEQEGTRPRRRRRCRVPRRAPRAMSSGRTRSTRSTSS